LITSGCIGGAGGIRAGIGKERLNACGRVEGTTSVAKERERSRARVLAAGFVKFKRGGPLAVFSEPVVLNKSAAAPVAVFESAVLRSSAPAPTAVLKLPVVTLNNENVPSAVFPRPKVREPIRRNHESPIQVRRTPSTFHPSAQRNAFRRRDVPATQLY
jgi:hypothetical protein